MGIQPFKRDLLKARVVDLYKQGLTFREIGEQLEMSHENARKIWKSTTIGEVVDKSSVPSSNDISS